MHAARVQVAVPELVGDRPASRSHSDGGDGSQSIPTAELEHGDQSHGWISYGRLSRTTLERGSYQAVSNGTPIVRSVAHGRFGFSTEAWGEAAWTARDLT